MRATMFLAVALVALAAAAAIGEAAVVEHTFVVSEMNMTHMCKSQRVVLVNEQFPGPNIEVTEGDTVVVHVINSMAHGLTIHWHGVKQQLSCWADGAGKVTQCPLPGYRNQTYRFNVTGQVGTLWWHAHVTCLRATVHGLIIIRPKAGPRAYPFPRPDKDIPLIIGEWWQLDMFTLDDRMADGNFDDNPVSATINGMLGDLSNCSGTVEESFVTDVEPGKTYLFRMVNAALFSEYYFKVAGHTFTVVGADANYLKPYKTDLIAVAPGETIDFLMVADAAPGKYHMIALANQPPEPDLQIPIFLSRGIVQYPAEATDRRRAPAGIPTPVMPHQHDTLTTFYFHNNLTGLPYPERPRVPLHVDEHFFVALGLGSICRWNKTVCKRRRSNETIVVATMNNVSFELPTKISLLEAHYNGVPDVYTDDFPHDPPVFYNFTDTSMIPPGPKEEWLEPTAKETKLRRFRYNTTIQMIFQSTSLLGSDSNPMHLHGHDFFVLAQGRGNFNPKKDFKKFNLVNPQLRNTVQVPRVGWAAIRLTLDNPGMWFFHCHFEFHIVMGMGTAFIVENGPTPDTTLPPPPADFPKCGSN